MKNFTPGNSFIQAFRPSGRHFSPQPIAGFRKQPQLINALPLWESLRFPYRVLPVLGRFSI